MVPQALVLGLSGYMLLASSWRCSPTASTSPASQVFSYRYWRYSRGRSYSAQPSAAWALTSRASISPDPTPKTSIVFEAQPVYLRSHARESYPSRLDLRDHDLRPSRRCIRDCCQWLFNMSSDGCRRRTQRAGGDGEELPRPIEAAHSLPARRLGDHADLHHRRGHGQALVRIRGRPDSRSPTAISL